MTADRLAAHDLLQVDATGLGGERTRIALARGDQCGHPVDRPGEVDGRRTRAPQLGDRRRQLARGACREGDPHGPRDADQRGTPHRESMDRFGDLLPLGGARMQDPSRQQRLVEVDDRVVVDPDDLLRPQSPSGHVPCSHEAR